MEGGKFECNQILDIFCFWLVVVALVFTWVSKNKNIPLKFYVVDLLIKMHISCHCIGHHLIPDTFEYLYPWGITEPVDFVLGSLWHFKIGRPSWTQEHTATTFVFCCRWSWISGWLFSLFRKCSFGCNS